VVATAFLIDSVGIETCPRENTMASAILHSAKRGAYLAIGLYLAVVLFVSIASQMEHSFDAPIQVDHPGVQFEVRSQSVMVDRAELAGVGGA
jgi:hypothetical protein